MVGSADKWGVRAAYATGEIKYDWSENFRSDGLRFDYDGLGSARFVSCELIGYFAHSSPPDDEVSGKMGGGKHSSGSTPKCYDIGIDCRNGNSRYRMEEEHPNGYSDGVSGGKGIGLSSNYVGYKFIKWNKPNGVLLELWQDQGDNNGETPANAWKKISSWMETSKKWFIPPSDHQETIRIDEVSTSNLKWKWLSLREIKTTDTESGGGGSDGGGSTPTPGGGGDGECTPLPNIEFEDPNLASAVDPLGTVYVKFKNGTQQSARMFTDQPPLQRQIKSAEILTIPYGTVIWEDHSITIRRDNVKPTPPLVPFTGVVADFITFKDGTQMRVDLWNDLSDDVRANRIDDISTIPYHHDIWEDGTISIDNNLNTPNPPANYTGKVAHYTTAINPSLIVNSGTGEKSSWAELVNLSIQDPTCFRVLNTSNYRRVTHFVIDDGIGLGNNLKGRTVNILRVSLRSHNSPLGTVYARHWSNNGHVKATIGQLDASLIPDQTAITDGSEWKDFEFTNQNNRVSVARGDRIGIEYIAADNSTEATIDVGLRTQSITDNSLGISVLDYGNSNSIWEDDVNSQLWGNIWTYVTVDLTGTRTNIVTMGGTTDTYSTAINTAPTFPVPAVKGMKHMGGRTFPYAVIYFIFARDWNTRTSPFSRQVITDKINTIFQSTYFDHILQYGIRRPKIGSIVTNTTYTGFSATPSPHQVGECILDSIARNQVPSHTGRKQHLYLVILPYGSNHFTNTSTQIGGMSFSYQTVNGQAVEDTLKCASICTGSSAYTSTFSMDWLTISLTNEIIEPITNPDGTNANGSALTSKDGWVADPNILGPFDTNGNRIADVCEGQGYGNANMAGMKVSPYYSNHHGACILPDGVVNYAICPVGSSFDSATQMCKGTTPTTGGGGGTTTDPPATHVPAKLAAPKTSVMIYKGGPVWSGAVCHFIFAGSGGTSWANVTNPTRARIIEEIRKHFNSTYYDRCIQYNVKRPKLGNIVTNENTTISDSYTVAEILNVVYNAIETGQVPARSPNIRHMYYVITKPGKNNQFNGGGWHVWTQSNTSDPYGTGYVVGCSIHRELNAIMGATTHELVSMITNPVGAGHAVTKQGWVADSNKVSIQYGEEVPDICVLTESDSGAKARGYQTGAEIVNDVFCGKWYSNMDGTCQASKTHPTWISCPSGSTWDNVAQACKLTNPSTGGGTTSPTNPTITTLGGIDTTQQSHTILTENGGYKKIGVSIQSGSSGLGRALLGKVLTTVSFWLRGVSTPEGQVYFRHQRQSGEVKTTFGSVSAASLVTSGYGKINLTNSSNTEVVELNDRITVEYVSSVGSANDTVGVQVKTSGFDNSVQFQYVDFDFDDTNWESGVQAQPRCSFMGYTPGGSTGGGGTTTPPPTNTDGGGSTVGTPVPLLGIEGDDEFHSQLNEANAKKTANEIKSNSSGMGKALVGKPITTATFWMKGYNTPAGRVYARQWGSDGSVKVTFGSKDAATLPLNPSSGDPVDYQRFDFTNATNRVPVSVGDRIGIEYVSSAGSEQDMVAVQVKYPNLTDYSVQGTIVRFTSSSNSSWETFTDDFQLRCSFMGISSTSTTQPPTGGGTTTPPPTTNTNIILATPKTRGMIDYGGLKWPDATVHVIFGGAEWKTINSPYSMQNMVTALNTIFNSSYFDALIQYGIRRPKLGTVVINDTYNFPDEVYSGHIGDCIKDSITRGKVPSNTGQKQFVYVVFLGSEYDLKPDGAAGQHFVHIVGVTNPRDGITGAVVRYMDFQESTATFTHELVECLARPVPYGGTENLALWGDPKVLGQAHVDQYGYEISDACESGNTSSWGTVNGVTVHKYYSNQDGQCTYSPTSPPSWVSCATGATFNKTSQTCVVSGGGTGGGTTTPPPTTDSKNPAIGTIPQPQAYFRTAGPVYSAPNVYVIFEGSAWNTQNSPYSKEQIINRINTIQASTYFDGLIQYGAKKPASWKFVTNTTNSLPNSYTDENVKTFIEASKSQGLVPSHLPTTQKNIYIVISAVGKTISGGNATGINWSYGPTSSTPENSDTVMCAVTAQATADLVTKTLTHELVEAMTSPIAYSGKVAWTAVPNVLPPTPLGATAIKIADMAEGLDPYIMNGVGVSKYWSNMDKGLIPPPNLPSWIICPTGYVYNTTTQMCEFTSTSPPTGGGGTTTPPPSGGGTTTPPPSTGTPTYTAGNANMLLYKTTGRTANYVEGPFKTRHYASGKPDDVTKEWNAQTDSSWKNYTTTLYVTITEADHDDAISIKMYGPSHNDGQGAWYIFDIDFYTGKTYWKWEKPHPDTFPSGVTGETIGSIMNKKIGIQVVIWQLATGGAHMEAWIDTGDKKWKKVTATDNPAGKIFTPDPNQKQQVRIDAAPGIIMHEITLKENTPNGEFVGTGGSTTPPTGGGTAPCNEIDWDYGGEIGTIEEGIPINLIEFNELGLTDPVTGEFVVIGWDSNFDGKADAWDENGDGQIDAIDVNGDGIPDVFDLDGDGRAESFDTDLDGIIDKTGNFGIGGGAGMGTGGGGLGTGTGSGGVGGGTNTPNPSQPPPIIYVTKQFPVIYSIDTINEDSCSISLPEEEIEPSKVFEAAGDINQFMETRNYRKIGVISNADDSSIINKKISRVDVVMKKMGNATITGSIYCRIRSGSNDTVMQQFDTVLNSTVFTGNEQTYSFTIKKPTYTVNRGDTIFIEYPKGSGDVNDTIGGDVDNYIAVKVTEKDKTDSVSTCLAVHDGNALTKFPNRDLACVIWA